MRGDGCALVVKLGVMVSAAVGVGLFQRQWYAFLMVENEDARDGRSFHGDCSNSWCESGSAMVQKLDARLLSSPATW